MHQISHLLQCRCGLRSKQIESIKPSGEKHNNKESEYLEKAVKEERQSPTARRRKPWKENRTRRAPSCGETCTIQDALCSCGYSHFRNIGNRQPPFIIWRLEGKFPPSQNCPKPAVAATNDCGNSCRFQNQTAALELSPRIALQVHILIINLQYCFTIKRSHCNTGAASRSHSLHGARPQDDTDTRSWLKSATARCTEDTQGYLGPAVQKTSLPPPLPLCHLSHHTLFPPFLPSHFTLFSDQERCGKECFWGTSKWRLLIWYLYEFRYV